MPVSSFFAKIFKSEKSVLPKILGSEEKAAAQAVKVAKKAGIKTAAQETINTSSKIEGLEKGITSGGRRIPTESIKNFASGVGSTAKVGGKVIGGVGIVAIPAAAGLYGYDRFKDIVSRQPQYYQTKNDTKNYEDRVKALEDYMNLLNEAQQNGINTNNPFLGAIPSLPNFNTQNSGGVPADNTKWYVIGALGLALAGAYAYSKRGKK